LREVKIVKQVSDANETLVLTALTSWASVSLKKAGEEPLGDGYIVAWGFGDRDVA
jgi:hypothetical protein